LQALQHRQGILVGTTIFRSGEDDNTELCCHAGENSFRAAFTSDAIRWTSCFVSS
jgi:hypothetical protein